MQLQPVSEKGGAIRIGGNAMQLTIAKPALSARQTAYVMFHNCSRVTTGETLDVYIDKADDAHYLGSLNFYNPTFERISFPVPSQLARSTPGTSWTIHFVANQQPALTASCRGVSAAAQ